MPDFEMEPGAEEELLRLADGLFRERLGPAIEADAKRYAPKRTGHLADSISHEVEDHTLRVVADTDYAAAVETGHRLVAWGHETGEHIEAQPYLRPALYQTRGE